MEEGNIASVEGLLMLPIAFFFDLISILWFTNFLAAIVIGGWAFSRYLGSEPQQSENGETENGEQDKKEKELEEQRKASEKLEEENASKSNKEGENKKEESRDASKSNKEKESKNNGSKNTSGDSKVQIPEDKKPTNLRELASYKKPSRRFSLDIKGRIRRFVLGWLIKLIPILGGLWPAWTIFVWKELKSK